MAERHAISAYMNTVLGINQESVRAALLNNGLDTWDSFLTLGVSGIKEVCDNIRKPGGMLPAVGDAAPQPNRGTAIPVVNELCLKQAAYMARFFHLTQRTWNHQQATRARIQELWDYKTGVEEATAPEPVALKKYTRDSNVWELFQDL